METRLVIFVAGALLSSGGCTFDRGGLPAAPLVDGASDAPLLFKDAATDTDAELTPGVDGPEDGSPDVSSDAVPDTIAWDTIPPDTVPPPDIGGGPIVIQAESFTTQKSLDGTHNWVVSTDVAGYSGSSFILASPTSSTVNCNSNITSCGAQADYSFTLTTSGTHYFHFRVYYSTPDSNS